MKKCNIPSDYWGCFKYHDCRAIELYKDNNPDPIATAAIILSLAFGITVIYAVVKWIQTLLT